jgi:uncharacterized protein Veg
LLTDKINSLFDIIYIEIYNIQCGKRVFNMEKANVLASIRKNIEEHVGDRVTLKANGGRRKVFVNSGVIEKAYPSIFVIRLENDTQRKVTYSYSDVLTKTVQLVFAV